MKKATKKAILNILGVASLSALIAVLGNSEVLAANGWNVPGLVVIIMICAMSFFMSSMMMSPPDDK